MVLSSGCHDLTFQVSLLSHKISYPQIWRQMGGGAAVDNTLLKKWGDVNLLKST